jgi:hypothetical protein
MSEQERADALARDLERLMAGELLPEGDPLLEVASALSRLPLQPSEQATLRFEQRLGGWFGKPALPPRRRIPLPVMVAGAVIAAIVVGLLLVILSNRPVSVPTPTAMPTAVPPQIIIPAITPTSSPSLSPSPAPTSTAVTATATYQTATSATLSATPPTQTITPQPFSRVVVAGPIESLQGGTIVILGQSIQVTGSLPRMCVGDLVRIEVNVSADGSFHADRSGIVVETNACSSGPAAGGQGSSGGSGSGDGRRNDDDHHHDD